MLTTLWLCTVKQSTSGIVEGCTTDNLSCAALTEQLGTSVNRLSASEESLKPLALHSMAISGIYE